MTNRKFAILPGDGIGPEIAQATRNVLVAASNRFGLGLEFSTIDIGFRALEKAGSTFPDSAFAAVRECDGIILGPVSHN